MVTPLAQKIKDTSATVAIIGQGYVGLPLALAIQKAGFFVYGFDTNEEKISSLKKGVSYIDDVSREEVKEAIEGHRFVPTSNPSALKDTDIAIIAVPTPLDEYKIPDISAIKAASEMIASNQKQGEQLVILESTTYPGTTDEIVLPILAKNSGKRSLYLAFSPERVDPGNKTFSVTNTPKVVGGVDAQSTKLAAAFYGKIIERVVPVSSARVAEMTKLLENIFRIVNISLVNELALLSGKMGINIWEVIEAASTKPYGFMPFYPGPGVGGHCIAVDPFYLSYKAKQYGFFTRFIDLAGEINELMPHHVVTKVATALNYSAQKSINGSRILLIGVSYKKNIRDTRESAAYGIAEALHQKGGKMAYYDPYIEKFSIRNAGAVKKVFKLSSSLLAQYDAVVIITDHTDIDYELIARFAHVVVDTRNAVKGYKYKNVYRL